MSSPPRLYATDLSETEWAILEPLLPPAKPGGRPRKWPMRTIMDGVFYVIRSGCQWRLLPREYSPWQTVYHYFRRFRLDGTWEQLNGVLRGNECVSGVILSQCAIIDSHSVKATSIGGVRGYDGAKKLSGRKRHLLVDVNGLVLRAAVHAADLQDRAGGSLVLDDAKEEYPRIDLAWADQGYTGGGKTWIEEHLGWKVEIVRHQPRSVGSGRLSLMLMTPRRDTSSGSACHQLRRSSGGSFLGAGLPSARSVGLVGVDDWPRSTSCSARRVRP